MPDGAGVAALGPAQRLEPAAVVIVRTQGADAYHRPRCEAAGTGFFLDKPKQFRADPEHRVSLSIEQGVANHG